MVDILKKLNLEALKDKFISEKITPGTILKLSLTELTVLGVTDANDISKLKIWCSVYSGNSLQRSVSNFAGTPKFLLSKSVFENFIEHGFTIKEMSALLGISTRTAYRRMDEFNFKNINFSDVDENQLDHEIIQITEELPYRGQLIIRQILRQKGFHVQRYKICESVHRVCKSNVAARKKGILHWRVYNVQGPNYL